MLQETIRGQKLANLILKKGLAEQINVRIDNFNLFLSNNIIQVSDVGHGGGRGD
jgi:hypothetical protein